MRYVQVFDERTQGVLARRAAWHGSMWHRFRGLMLRRALPEGEGIVLIPCNSVHMALMRFAIDVLYLDRENTVVKTVHSLRPYRISLGGRRAHAAIELPVGTLMRTQVERGDRIRMKDLDTAEAADG